MADEAEILKKEPMAFAGTNKLLFWAHLAQVTSGSLMAGYLASITTLGPLLVAAEVLILTVGLVGCILLRRKSWWAYPSFVLFNVPQLIWITSEKYRYGFQFGFQLKFTLSDSGAYLALNLVALTLGVLSVASWANFFEDSKAKV